MMIPNRKITLIWASLLGLGLLGVLAAWLSFSDGRRQVSGAERDYLATLKAINIIKAQKARPAVAALDEMQGLEISRLLESAASSAGIDKGTIDVIYPRRAVRVGQTAYKEKPTEIRFKNISLRQLVDFLYEVCVKADHFRVKSIRLGASRETTGQWKTEVVLSYLIYSPN